MRPGTNTKPREAIASTAASAKAEPINKISASDLDGAEDPEEMFGLVLFQDGDWVAEDAGSDAVVLGELLEPTLVISEPTGL
jgi:hypothetical protein